MLNINSHLTLDEKASGGRLMATRKEAKHISACSSGNWTYDEASGDNEFGPDSLVTDATREHESLAVRYHKLSAPSHRAAAVSAIHRIHADGVEHISALVY